MDRTLSYRFRRLREPRRTDGSNLIRRMARGDWRDASNQLRHMFGPRNDYDKSSRFNDAAVQVRTCVKDPRSQRLIIPPISDRTNKNKKNLHRVTKHLRRDADTAEF